MEVIPKMALLTLSNADIQFAEKELTLRSYTIEEALPTTQRIELINKKKLTNKVLDKESETFVMYVAALEAPLAGMTIDLS